MHIILKIFFFALGAIVGSFLNVCVHRLPRGESIVSPGSRCPKCGRHIRWYDNIPMLSYVILRGRCRHCGSGISGRYFVVELITAFLFLTLFLRFGLTVNLLVYLAFTSSLIIMSFIDFEHKIIPDILDCPGIVIGFVVSMFLPEMHVRPQPWDSTFGSPAVIAAVDSLSGIILGGGFLVVLAIVGKAVFKKEAMGLTVFLSAIIGSVVGIVAKLRMKGSYIPYGPYLALGAIISIFYGERIILWYLGRLGM
jgi:leader peptidase (prepilin peptidase)/N-methyltransferase